MAILAAAIWFPLHVHNKPTSFEFVVLLLWKHSGCYFHMPITTRSEQDACKTAVDLWQGPNAWVRATKTHQARLAGVINRCPWGRQVDRGQVKNVVTQNGTKLCEKLFNQPYEQLQQRMTNLAERLLAIGPDVEALVEDIGGEARGAAAQRGTAGARSSSPGMISLGRASSAPVRGSAGIQQEAMDRVDLVGGPGGGRGSTSQGARGFGVPRGALSVPLPEGGPHSRASSSQQGGSIAGVGSYTGEGNLGTMLRSYAPQHQQARKFDILGSSRASLPIGHWVWVPSNLYNQTFSNCQVHHRECRASPNSSICIRVETVGDVGPRLVMKYKCGPP